MNQDPPHSFASVQGLRLHWVDLGPKDDAREPLVLLHGLNDSYLTWRRVAPTLAVDRRVLMPDLPGYGLSERPDASYELHWHARVIGQWLEQIGLKKVDLAGHSFGGGVALAMLNEFPGLVRRLMLLAPGGLGRDVTLALRLASLPGVVQLFGERFMALATRIALRGEKAGFSQEDVASFIRLNSVPGSARAFARTVRDVIDLRGQRRSFVELARAIDALPPIAVFWGDRDTIIPMSHGEAFADFVEGVVFHRFHRCGHYVHNEQPERFIELARAFLDAASVPAVRLRDAPHPPKLAERRVGTAWSPPAVP